ncbi:MAG: glycosyltransferase [Candidatus Eisenbacteria bacterium]|nr:glycosyltransferase [Candidatus Eisenbacteria bacterium]
MEIVCFGSADYEEPNWVNAQHLMWRLAERHRVLYVNSLGLRPPRAARGDLRKIGRRLAALWRGVLRRPHADRDLHLLTPWNLPSGRGALREALGARLLSAQLRGALQRLGFRTPLVWSFLPSAAPVIARLAPAALVYHCVDAYEVNPGVDADWVRAQERRLLRRADCVIASSAPLQARLAARHPDVRLMPNVADLDLYPPPGQPPPEPPELRPIGRPRIGYLGNLAAYKCDLPLLARAARARADLSWIFIGALGRGEAPPDLGALRTAARVHLLGERPREALPGLLHHLDVGLIPFARNETTRHSFPMKFFEYLACGLPIVCPPLDSLRAHARPPHAYPYATEAEFLPAIEAALGHRDPAAARARRTLAEQHSWTRRMQEIEGLLGELRARVPLLG